MSRTDRHRPARVQQLDPHNHHDFVVEHNHFVREDWDEDLRRWLVRRVAPCDFHQFVESEGHDQTRCRPVYIGGRNIYCGCPLCTGALWCRQELS